MRTVGVFSSDKRGLPGGRLNRNECSTHIVGAAGTRHAAGGSSHMDAVSTDRREQAARSGRGALGWAVFVVIAMVVVAAVFAGLIRSRLSPPDIGARPSLSSTPSPAPTPLPRPGPPGRGTQFAAF